MTPATQSPGPAAAASSGAESSKDQVTSVPFYGHVRQYNSVRDEIDSAIQQVVTSGQYILGPTLHDFERDLAAYCGTRDAIGVNSGTDALWLALMALGIGPGDEVITVGNTFFGTVEAIWISGATAVLVDSDPRTYCVDVDAIQRAVTARTRAIIPVHLYGQCVNMRAVRDIAAHHRLHVVEDAAQAIGARGDGFRVGEIGDATAMSFIVNKNLGTFGDAGAVLTNSDEVASTVRRLRNHGSATRGVHSMGFNSRLDDLHAGILAAKLRHLDEWTARRRELARRYTMALSGSPLITLPFECPGGYHVFHLYVVHIEQSWMRDDLIQWLERAGVEVKIHYPIAVHQQEGFPWGRAVRVPTPLYNVERNAALCVSLPLYPEMSDGEVDYVAGHVLKWVRAVRSRRDEVTWPVRRPNDNSG